MNLVDSVVVVVVVEMLDPDHTDKMYFFHPMKGIESCNDRTLECIVCSFLNLEDFKCNANKSVDQIGNECN